MDIRRVALAIRKGLDALEIGIGALMGQANREMERPADFRLGQMRKRPRHGRDEALEMADVGLQDGPKLGRHLGHRPRDKSRRRVLMGSRVSPKNGRPQQGAQDFPQRRRAAGLGLRFAQHGVALAVHLPGSLAEDAEQERTFGPEVIADRGQIDAGLVNDVAHRHAVETAVGEQPFGGEKDPRLGIGSRLGSRSRGRGLQAPRSRHQRSLRAAGRRSRGPAAASLGMPKRTTPAGKRGPLV